MEAQYFIDIFLPDFVSQAFDVVNMQSGELRIESSSLSIKTIGKVYGLKR